MIHPAAHQPTPPKTPLDSFREILEPVRLGLTLPPLEVV